MEEYEAVQEAVFESLKVEECSEEQCIRKIQDALQIENLFILQLIREGKDTQVSVTLIDLDKKRVESDYCEGCNILTLNQKIGELLNEIKTERIHELESEDSEPLRQRVSFLLEGATIPFNQLLIDSKNTKDIKVSWSLPGLGYGLGVGRHYVELRYLTENGTVDEFFFLNASGGYQVSQVAITILGGYYTPFAGP